MVGEEGRELGAQRGSSIVRVQVQGEGLTQVGLCWGRESLGSKKGDRGEAGRESASANETLLVLEIVLSDLFLLLPERFPD